MGLTKSRGNMYPWVSHTWNPIKGHCQFECPYCYVKASGRLKQYQEPCHLVEKELLTSLGKDRTIFVGSMGDMWGPWVEYEWIQRVLGRCTEFKNTYIFQSKNPGRFIYFAPWLGSLNLVYLGTTIETDRYPAGFQTNAPSIDARIYSMHNLSRESRVKTFVTIEPIMKFNLKALLDNIRFMNPDFVTIGADSKGHGLVEPTWAEVQRLIENLGLMEIEIRQKKNLDRLRLFEGDDPHRK